MSDVKEYLPHQQRVVDEKNELEDKFYKLHEFIDNNFIFKSLSYAEQSLLQQQATYMGYYLDILKQRISLF